MEYLMLALILFGALVALSWWILGVYAILGELRRINQNFFKLRYSPRRYSSSSEEISMSSESTYDAENGGGE